MLGKLTPQGNINNFLQKNANALADIVLHHSVLPTKLNPLQKKKITNSNCKNV